MLDDGFDLNFISKRKPPTTSVTITIQDKENWMDEFMGMASFSLASLLETEAYNGIYSTVSPQVMLEESPDAQLSDLFRFWSLSGYYLV
jgi:hypothetical protein